MTTAPHLTVLLLGALIFQANIFFANCQDSVEDDVGDEIYSYQVVTKITANDVTAVEKEFGTSCAIGGDFAIVGAGGCFDTVCNDGGAGQAYVFELVKDNVTGLSNWIQVDRLIPTSTVVTSIDYYAWTVGIYGEFALIGANGDSEAGDAAGAAYVFKRTGTVWAEHQKLTADDPVDWDYLGRNVWIGELTLIIGSRYSNEQGNDSGSAYVFSRDDRLAGGVISDQWKQVVKLTASDGALKDEFGSAVWMDQFDRNVLIAAYHDDAGGENAGAAYVFDQRLPDPSIRQRAKLTASDGNADDEFGNAVCIRGLWAIVGAAQNDPISATTGAAMEDAGAVYVFYNDVQANGDASWSQHSKLSSNDLDPGDRFGVSLVFNGSHFVVGANNDDAGGENAGAAYVFLVAPVPSAGKEVEVAGTRRAGSDWMWVQAEKLMASDYGKNDDFGSAVAFDMRPACECPNCECQVMIGARFKGAEYVFSPSHPPTFAPTNGTPSVAPTILPTNSTNKSGGSDDSLLLLYILLPLFLLLCCLCCLLALLYWRFCFVAGAHREKNLFTIGNPIVDLHFSAAPEWCTQRVSQKIIHSRQQEDLFNELAENDCDYKLCKLTRVHGSEVLVRAGGSTQNTARVAQALLVAAEGSVHDVTFVGCVGDDKWGGAMKEAALDDGLRDIVYEVKAASTAKCALPRIYTQTDGGLLVERSCITNLGVTEEHSVTCLDSKLVEKKANLAAAFYSAGYFCVTWSNTAHDVARMANDRGVPFATNLSCVQLMNDPSLAVRMLHLLPYCDYLFGTVEQAAAFGRSTGTGVKLNPSPRSPNSLDTDTAKEEDLLDAAEMVAAEIASPDFRENAISRSGSCIVVLTNGESDTMVVTSSDDQAQYYTPHELDEGQVVIDHIGTGDAFVGGFLAQLLLKPNSEIGALVNEGHRAAKLCLLTVGCGVSAKEGKDERGELQPDNITHPDQLAHLKPGLAASQSFPLDVHVGNPGYFNKKDDADMPWGPLTIRTLMIHFNQDEEWKDELNVQDLAGILQAVLNLPSNEAYDLAVRLFPSFDRDRNGWLDFRELFIGMSMLCNDSRDEKLRAIFSIMDADNSGQIDHRELEHFLVTVAPWNTKMEEVQSIAARAMAEADVNGSGFITYDEFARWPGKGSVVAWFDLYLDRARGTYTLPQTSIVIKTETNHFNSIPDYKKNTLAVAGPPSKGSALPWARLNTRDLMTVVRDKTWQEELTVSDLAVVLQQLLSLTTLESSSLANRLFPAFDRDGSGTLDFRELFIGIAMLCSGNHDEKLDAVFQIMDEDNSGGITDGELAHFLVTVAPWDTNGSEVSNIAARIMKEADINEDGFITFGEFQQWPGKHKIVDWVEAYLERVTDAWRESERSDVPDFELSTSFADDPQPRQMVPVHKNQQRVYEIAMAPMRGGTENELSEIGSVEGSPMPLAWFGEPSHPTQGRYNDPVPRNMVQNPRPAQHITIQRSYHDQGQQHGQQQLVPVPSKHHDKGHTPSKHNERDHSPRHRSTSKHNEHSTHTQQIVTHTEQSHRQQMPTHTAMVSKPRKSKPAAPPQHHQNKKIMIPNMDSVDVRERVAMLNRGERRGTQ